jgi:hypothetical protein
MSVSSVHMFYAKLASDMMLRDAFAEATAEFTIKFAAERGYMFNGYDLQIAGETLQGHAKQVSDDVRQMLQLQQQLQQQIGQSTGLVAGAMGPNPGAKPTGVAGASGLQAVDGLLRALSSIDTALVHDRLGEIFGTHGGFKRASGGG